MPVTHGSCKVELFGSHCGVGLCSHGRAGSWRLRRRRVLMLLRSVLFYLAVCGSHPVLLFRVVQPSALQTLRCFVKMQVLIQQIDHSSPTPDLRERWKGVLETRDHIVWRMWSQVGKA